MIECCVSYKIYFNIYSICKRTFKYILPFSIVAQTLVAPCIAQIPKKNSVKRKFTHDNHIKSLSSCLFFFQSAFVSVNNMTFFFHLTNGTQYNIWNDVQHLVAPSWWRGRFRLKWLISNISCILNWINLIFFFYW